MNVNIYLTRKEVIYRDKNDDCRFTSFEEIYIGSIKIAPNSAYNTVVDEMRKSVLYLGINPNLEIIIHRTIRNQGDEIIKMEDPSPPSIPYTTGNINDVISKFSDKFGDKTLDKYFTLERLDSYKIAVIIN